MLRQNGLRDKPEGHRRDQARDDHALVQGIHDLAAFRHLDEEGADDRGDDRRCAQRQRVDDGGVARILHDQTAQQHGGHQRDGVGLEQIGRHTGAVTDVVTDVVGDGGRVARIVLGDALLDLADEVSADVSGLGEDTATNTHEHREHCSTETKTFENGWSITLVNKNDR